MYFFQRVTQQVYLAELLISQPELKNDIENLDIQAFVNSGKSMDTLVEEASVIREKFRIGSWILGAFIGLVFGIKLLNQFVYRKREDYEPDKGECLSCGRCMDYCPVES
jgi:NosR/NirI family nitrous oxide reductase transcriptional regulator